MCTTCGCNAGEVKLDGQTVHDHAGSDGRVYRHAHADAHDHSHPHPHGLLHLGRGETHAHAPGLSPARVVRIERDILARNNGHAAENRGLLQARGILGLNLVSSPGSGKTTLLVRTLRALPAHTPVAVIEGDQQTANDAERIRATGTPAIQINTGKGCHLDAQMVGQALQRLVLPEGGLLFIENVGNLVCPAAFDLGEAAKVVILSVTEGEDKPLKYPDMFRAARLLLLNKCDLLPHLDFDVALAIENALRINPELAIIRVSAVSGEGLDDWLGWLARERASLTARQNTSVIEAA
ncbi:MAG: hydrogenase accessory protein HypB [Betaproteobacteria bacterium HGW-Betaproteobacteria-11]|nr:MAG: hydrogenase accessory protein HypB [Betaproteobacteria bacterium HGW-Betaproteobacteria-11]